MKLSTPNRITRLYFSALRRRVDAMSTISDEEILRQEVALCILLSVAIVEAFLNTLFRIVVSESEFQQHSERIMKDLKGRKTLGQKLKDWPTVVFGKPFQETAKVAVEFKIIRTRRNALMHFTSSHETFKLPGLAIGGLSDTSAFDELSALDATNALHVAENLVGEIFRLRGIPEEEIPHAVHLWTGKNPF